MLFRARNGHPLYCIDWELYSKKFKNYGNAFIALDIIDGLKFKTTFNYYINRSDRDEYQPKDHNMGPNAMDAGYGYKNGIGRFMSQARIYLHIIRSLVNM